MAGLGQHNVYVGNGSNILIDGSVTLTPGVTLSQVLTEWISFGAADAATYEIVGTKGTLRVKQAYEFTEPMKMEITVANKTTRHSFPKRDQFGPEIRYFSDCILKNHEPEPSGQEGLIDVHVIRSLYESARTGRAVCLNRFNRRERPDLRQEISRPAREPLALIHTEPPNR